MDCPRGFSGIQAGTLFNRLLGIRTFLKAATQRMGAHGVPRHVRDRSEHGARSTTARDLPCYSVGSREAGVLLPKIYLG